MNNHSVRDSGRKNAKKYKNSFNLRQYKHEKKTIVFDLLFLNNKQYKNCMQITMDFYEKTTNKNI